MKRPLLLIMGVFFLFIASSTALAFENYQLVEIAKKYNEQNVKIECKAFVQKVVREAGGNLSQGYNYCYLDVGKEVTVDEATAGDIIQLDSEKNHDEKYDRKGGAAAYTRPMHAAIIIENLSNKTYRVIDSNFFEKKFPMTVKIHDWNPWITAGSKLHVHFYRLGTVSSPAPQPQPQPQPIPAPEKTGSKFDGPVTEGQVEKRGNSYLFVVPANRFGWTRIHAPNGNYAVLAMNKYRWDPMVSEPVVGPNGASWTPNEVGSPEEFPLPQAPIAGFIGKIDKSILYLGEKGIILDISKGYADFGINERWADYCYTDNSGNIIVILTPAT